MLLLRGVHAPGADQPDGRLRPVLDRVVDLGDDAAPQFGNVLNLGAVGVGQLLDARHVHILNHATEPWLLRCGRLSTHAAHRQDAEGFLRDATGRCARPGGHVDFVSIGTNDLVQYTFAADRMAPELGALLDPWQPALLDLVAGVCSAGTALGRAVGVCGEAAGDPLLAAVLSGLGVGSLSMAAPTIASVRDRLARVGLGLCLELAAVARSAPSAELARHAGTALTVSRTARRAPSWLGVRSSTR